MIYLHQLIKRLQEVFDEHGDLAVILCDVPDDVENAEYGYLYEDIAEVVRFDEAAMTISGEGRPNAVCLWPRNMEDPGDLSDLGEETPAPDALLGAADDGIFFGNIGPGWKLRLKLGPDGVARPN